MSKERCDLINYLRLKNKDIYKIVEDFCLYSQFSPAIGKKTKTSLGLSFIIPSKKTVETLKKLAKKDDVDEVVKLLRSHLLLGIPNTKTIKSKSGVNYDVEVVSKKDVDLFVGKNNSVRLILEEKFDKSVVHIYKIKSGDVSISDQNETMVEEKKETSGGRDELSPEVSMRIMDARKLYEEFCYLRSKGNLRDPYLEFVGGFIGTMEALQKINNSVEYKKELDAIHAILDPCPFVSYHLIFEPYKNPSHNKTYRYIIPNSVYKKVRSTMVIDNPDKVYKNHMQPTVNADQKAIQEVKEDIRRNVCTQTKYKNIVHCIQMHYEELLSSGGVKSTPFGIDDLAGDLFKSEPHMKLWQDLFRLNIGEEFRRSTMPRFNWRAFRLLNATIINCHAGNDYKQELIFNYPYSTGISAPLMEPSMQELNYITLRFLISSDFLYVPRSADDLAKEDKIDYKGPDTAYVNDQANRYMCIEHAMKVTHKDIDEDLEMKSKILEVIKSSS
jgi:hypothetical protein